MNKQGKTLTYWEDLEDNNRPYNEGDIYPHKEISYEVTEERFNSLASKENKRGIQLIDPIELTDVKAISDMNLTELRSIAKERGLTGYSDLNKAELIEKLSE